VAPLDSHLQPGVERLPHPAGQQGHHAQQPDDFPLAGQGQARPDPGRVGSGGAQLGRQVHLGRVGQFGADLGQPGGDRRRLSVPVAAAEGLTTRVVRALDDAGIQVNDVTIGRASLDDVFLSLTGHLSSDDDEEGSDAA
jgi:hypothetical protein